jgi:hypothetical protein
VAEGDEVVATKGSTEEDGLKRDVPDDMKHLVMTEEELAAAMKSANETNSAPKKSRTRTKSKFTMFPDAWDDQLARVKADGCTYRVALSLLREKWRAGDSRVKLANVALEARNVSRWSKQHALDQLVEAGLISIERRPRKSPIVMVKFAD